MGSLFDKGDTDKINKITYINSLGDLCDIASAALGMTWSARVTEVSYICEGGCVRVEPRFGSHVPDLRTLLQRLE